MAHVLITGGSSGIGLALASLLLKRGDRVSLLARDPDRLSAARNALISGGASTEAIFIASVDVTDQKALNDAVGASEAEQGEVDCLIASAGMVEPALFDAQPADAFDRQVSINLTGVANSVRAVYAAMKARRRGRILVVSSGAGLIGIPGYSGYCASKFALRGFAASLRAEALSHDVTVSVCFPPDTLTPQYERELPLRPPEAALLMGKVRPWKVETVAGRMLAGFDRGIAEIHFGATLAILARIGPVLAPFIERRQRRRRSR
ncbi:MAG: SDR family oxidoreductase [Shinella sp.]|nr:SDR family oxidoreductase [Shinella sp.]